MPLENTLGMNLSKCFHFQNYVRGHTIITLGVILLIVTGVRPEDEVPLSPVAYLMYARSNVIIVCQPLGK